MPNPEILSILSYEMLFRIVIFVRKLSFINIIPLINHSSKIFIYESQNIPQNIIVSNNRFYVRMHPNRAERNKTDCTDDKE